MLLAVKYIVPAQTLPEATGDDAHANPFVPTYVNIADDA